jgi:UPF0755 protein
MLRKLLVWLGGLLLMGALAIVVTVVGLVALSGESPADFARALLARASLNGREADLAPVNPTDSTPIRIEVVSGTGALAIAEQLRQAGLIRDADLFVSYVRAEGISGDLEAGTYFLTPAQSLPDIALALTDSRSSFIPFRVLAGWRVEQIAEAIDSNPLFTFDGAAFLAAVNTGAGASPAFLRETGLTVGQSVEGFLYPDTYQLPPTLDAAGLVNTLTEAFLNRGLGIEGVANLRAQGRSVSEAVMLASIVQREAVRTEEMRAIAGVYSNRLNIGMKLDADPTVQYALGNTRGGWWPQITRADYSGVASPYNTYLNTGLPPTPIANPGFDALWAAIMPESTPYFYFRADCRDDGYHDFAVTYEEHLANGC